MKRNILVLDTDLISIDIYKECFSEDSLFVVRSDFDFENFLQTNTKIDIIIVDTDCFVELKEAKKNLIDNFHSIPIIVCSANERGGDALHTQSGFSVDIFSKPIQENNLLVRAKTLSDKIAFKCATKNKIMVIDDCDVQRKRLAYILSQSYLVETYKSATEAISNIEAGYNPDLIILDIIMDDVNGFEFIEYIRNSKELKTPIMCISTKAIPKFVSTALKLGANDYVYKPYNKSQLKKKVQLLL